MDIKTPGNLLFVVGETKNELGGSHYYKINDQLGANVPTLDLTKAAETAKRMSIAIADGLVVSCHDCSEGGLAVGLAEMAFAGGFGIEADLRGLPKAEDLHRIDAQLFSESNSRYLVEVAPGNYDAFARSMLDLPFGNLGKVTENKTLTIKNANAEPAIELDLDSLKQAWQQTFKW